jgi:hypothetical protein
MEPIFGTSGRLKLIVGGQPYDILCATDVTFRFQQREIGATTITSGKYEEWRVGLCGWSVSVTGLTKISNADGQIDFFYITQESVRGTVQQIQILYEDADGNGKVISGNVVIPSGELSASRNDFCNAVIEFKGTGAFNISDPEPAPGVVEHEILSDWWQTSNGNDFIDGASSGMTDGTPYTLQSTDEILEVDVEGTQFDEVNGSPGNREYQTDLANNKIKFNTTFDGSQRVFVLFRRPV